MQPEQVPPPRPSQPNRPGMDIVPSQQSMGQSSAPVSQPVTPASVPPHTSPDSELGTKKPKKRRTWMVVLGVIMTLIVAAVGVCFAAYFWYQTQLQPVTTDKSAARVRVTIPPGSTPDAIGKLLKEKGIIRDAFVFVLYAKNSGAQAKLQAGTFSLQPSDSLASIIDHLVAGKTDEFTITFLPGDTLAGHREKFIKAGYAAADVDLALKKSYTHPVLADKPATADLEGYIFGETYQFTADATLDDIMMRIFDQLYGEITKNDLINGYKKQDLTLYEGITLASIVQKEVADPDESKQVAQVFYKRLGQGMPLGADATFVYAAKKAGATPTVDFDSPYNTRTHQGLPPGPISSPGVQALLAVAAPAAGDYLFFVSGDDGKTYFSRTLEEHTALTAQHCKKNCSLF